MIWRVIWFSVAANQWFVVLAWYPLLCLTHVFNGDFSVIYGGDWWWIGSAVVAAVNTFSLAVYLWASYTQSGRRWVVHNLYQTSPPSSSPSVGAL